MRIGHVLVACFLTLTGLVAVQARWLDTYNRYAPDEIQKYDEFEEALGSLSDMMEDVSTGISEPGDDETTPSDILAGSLPNNGELFEGDMVMSDSLRDAILDEGEKRSSMAAAALAWPETEKDADGLYTVPLPYTASPEFKKTHGKLFEKAIQRYNEYTCIRLAPKKVENLDWLNFVSPKKSTDVCSSNVGRAGGKQDVTLGKRCHVLGTILHEIMHNLGFVHEHTRADRDQFVNVVWKNVKDADSNNFHKYEATSLRADTVPYNFDSIMHYRNDAFTKKELLQDDRQTLVAKRNDHMQFGQRADFSKGDARSVNEKYCMQTPEMKDKYRNEALYGDLIANTNGDSPAYLTAKRQRLEGILDTLKHDPVSHHIIEDLHDQGIIKFKEVLKVLKKDAHVHELLKEYKRSEAKAKADGEQEEE